MRLLFFGDVVGEAGRRALKKALPLLKSKYDPYFIIVNGENAAGGYGLTEKVANELLSLGVDLITSGNHIWKREFFPYLNHSDRVLRPANYGPQAPGKGFTILKKGFHKLGVINLEGRIFMRPLENPFFIGKDLGMRLREETPYVLVDFHAEATSEKIALGFFLDGLVSAVLGTHTHVQTSDERILPQGTGYITDVGMCGSLNSVIGMRVDQALELYLTMVGRKLEVETSPPYKVEGVFLEFGPSGETKTIESFREIIYL